MYNLFLQPGMQNYRKNFINCFLKNSATGLVFHETHRNSKILFKTFLKKINKSNFEVPYRILGKPLQVACQVPEESLTFHEKGTFILNLCSRPSKFSALVTLHISVKNFKNWIHQINRQKSFPWIIYLQPSWSHFPPDFYFLTHLSTHSGI